MTVPKRIRQQIHVTAGNSNSVKRLTGTVTDSGGLPLSRSDSQNRTSPYTPWPSTGCALAEVKSRISAAHHRDKRALTKELNEVVATGRLVRLGERPTRFLPAVQAPDRNKRFAGMALSEVFKTFLLGDPEVRAWAVRAIQAAPNYTAVFQSGRCTPFGVAEWPVAFERWIMIGYVHPDPARRSVYDVPRRADPIEVVFAAEALKDRYRNLITMLRKGELVAHGLSKSTQAVEAVPAAIWQHEDFHLTAEGDLCCCSDGSIEFVTIWRALELRRPAREVARFHVEPLVHSNLRPATGRKMPKADAVADALRAKGWGRRRPNLTFKEIASQIRSLLPANASFRSVDSLSKAIARHYSRRLGLK